MFERIIKYLSIFTFSFFILSYCYLSGYYGKVNVDILNYITGSEILYTMLPGAAWVISYCGLLFFFLPGVFSFARPKPTKETQAPTESIWTKKSWPATIVGYGVMTAICLLLLNYYFENFAQLVPYILLLVSLGTCAYVFRKHIQVAVASSQVSFVLYVILLIVIGYTTKVFGENKVAALVQTGNPDRITFKVKDKIYQTDSAHVVIGIVQSSLFYYDKIDSTVTVFNRSGVDSICIGPFKSPKKHLFF